MTAPAKSAAAAAKPTIDPPYITSMEHFESLRHDEIYAKAQQIDPAALAMASATWMEIAGTITAGFPAATAILDGVLNDERWHGAAADAAAQSARSISASATEFAEAMASVSTRLAAVAAAGEAVKLAVVPPNDRGPVAIITSLLSGASLMDAQQMEEALRKEAVLVMNTVYAPCYRPAGEGVPGFPVQVKAPVHSSSARHKTAAVAPAAPAAEAATAQEPGANHATEATPSPAPQTDNAPQAEQASPETRAPQAPHAAPQPAAPIDSLAAVPTAPQVHLVPGGQPGVTGPVPETPAAEKPQALMAEPKALQLDSGNQTDGGNQAGVTGPS